MKIIARGFNTGTMIEVRCADCPATDGAVAWALGGPNGATLADFAGPMACGGCGKVVAHGRA